MLFFVFVRLFLVFLTPGRPWDVNTWHAVRLWHGPVLPGGLEEVGSDPVVLRQQRPNIGQLRAFKGVDGRLGPFKNGITGFLTFFCSKKIGLYLFVFSMVFGSPGSFREFREVERKKSTNFRQKRSGGFQKQTNTKKQTNKHKKTYKTHQKNKNNNKHKGVDM